MKIVHIFYRDESNVIIHICELAVVNIIRKESDKVSLVRELRDESGKTGGTSYIIPEKSHFDEQFRGVFRYQMGGGGNLGRENGAK